MIRKVLLTCAVTGNAPYNPKHPNFPVTPKQIAEACVEAAGAGASAVHIHVRNPETGAGSRDPSLFREVVDRVRDTGTDIVLNLTGGLGGYLLPDPADESRALPESDVAGVDERLEHILDCMPEIASLDITTGNQVEGDLEFVYLNTTRTLRAMAQQMQAAGIKPELEVFQAGDVLFGNHLFTEGFLDSPPMYQFVLGVLWGAPADTETILYMKNLLPEGAQWGALGLAQMQMPVVAQTALLGGNVRVGLEDNLYLSRGVFASNGQLVERAATIIECIGGSVATPAEMRDILNLRKP